MYTKEGENGKANGDYKVADLDVAEVEAPAVKETKEATAETLTTNFEDGKKANGNCISKIKEVGPPQPQGLHALIQAVPNPEKEEVFLIPESIVGPVVLPQVFCILSSCVATVLICIYNQLVREKCRANLCVLDGCSE